MARKSTKKARYDSMNQRQQRHASRLKEKELKKEEYEFYKRLRK